MPQTNHKKPGGKSQKSKDAIQRLLKLRGPLSAADLAQELGVSSMAVRQHLYQLQDEELVVASSEPKGVGRPAKTWELTDKANAGFADAHADLTVDLIEAVKSAFGEEGMERLLDVRSEVQIEAYRKRLAGTQNLKQRVQALAEIRTEEGYMADVLREDGTLYLVENHCPVCRAARACTGLCAHELEVFQKVLGEGAQVERTQHILKGARRCAYRIAPSKKGAL